MRLDNTLDPDFPHRLEIEAAVREAFAPHAEEAWDVTILNSRAPGLLQIRILHEGGQRVTEFMIGTDDTPGQIREHVRRAAEKPMC